MGIQNSICMIHGCPIKKVAYIENEMIPHLDCCWYNNGICMHQNVNGCAKCKNGCIYEGHGLPDLHGSYCWECWNGAKSHFEGKYVPPFYDEFSGWKETEAV